MNFEITKNNNVYSFIINEIICDIDDFGYFSKEKENEPYQFFQYSFSDDILRKYHINYIEYENVVERIENVFNSFIKV